MIEINLAPDIKQELIKAQRIRAKVILGSILIGAGLIAVVVFLVVYIYAFQAVQNTSLADSINKKSAELAKVQDLSKTLTIQNQLQKIADLNANRKIDSRVFDLLVAINPPAPNNVDLSSLTIDSSLKSITVEGQALNSYAAVEVYKKTIEGAKIRFTDGSDSQKDVTIASEVTSSGTTYGEDTSGRKVLRFTISFFYADELVSPASKNSSIIITSNDTGNATDSYLGIPSSLFVPRAADITEGQ